MLVGARWCSLVVVGSSLHHGFPFTVVEALWATAETPPIGVVGGSRHEAFPGAVPSMVTLEALVATSMKHQRLEAT